MEQLNPGSFSFPPAEISADPLRGLFYFSLVTLTIVGYGDTTPVTPLAQGFSNLEAIIDISGLEHLLGSPRATGSRLKFDIYEATGLTAGKGRKAKQDGMGFDSNRLSRWKRQFNRRDAENTEEIQKARSTEERRTGQKCCTATKNVALHKKVVICCTAT